MSEAPERLWIDPDILPSESHKRYNCDVEYVRADRIEELKAENHLLKTAGVIEVAVRNPNVAEYIRHWEARAEAAEAKLAKAVGVAEKAIGWLRLYGADVHREAATLAELKGQDDD